MMEYLDNAKQRSYRILATDQNHSLRIDMRKIKITEIIITLILLLIIPLSAMGAKLYRWVDADGKVQYSDRVPPSQRTKEHSRLDESGIEVEKVKAARSKQEVEEELAREQALKRLRAEQQRLIDTQKAADRVLLRTFRSEDDIKMARDGKLTAIDVHIQVIRGNIKRLKNRLEDLQKGAADMERQGNKPSQSYLDDMTSLRQQIKDAYASIIVKERDKDTIWNNHEDDLQRFRTLKKLQPEKPGATPSQQTASLLETVVKCADTESCDQAWEKATVYVEKHATTRLQLASDIILLTRMPIQDDEFSLTVSRIADKEDKGAEIFLDLQCKNSPGGEKFCETDKIKAIRSGFRPALTP
jgi:hypothetical protein